MLIYLLKQRKFKTDNEIVEIIILANPKQKMVFENRKQIFNDLLNNQNQLNCLLNMRNLMDSDSQQRPISPTAFIAGLNRSQNPSQVDLDSQDEEQSQLLFGSVGKSLQEGTKGSKKSEKKRLAGLKSRQKKKRRLEYLQESVKQINSQIEHYDFEISKCKNQLVQAIKISTHNSSEHSFTFAEIQRAIQCQDPDLDRINMLVDLIQNRIGANGKERQSKLQYNFKQIINSLFPASHRYLMHSAVYSKDLFQENATCELLVTDKPNKWTKSFYQQLQLNQDQINKMLSMKLFFINKRRQTVTLIIKLKELKEQLKQQEQVFEKSITHLRQDMNPIQSAKLILYGESNKLRRQFSLFCDEFGEDPPQKKIKTQ